MSKPQPYAVLFRGRWACPCLAKWLPAYEAELKRRGIISGALTIYQLIGGAVASAGTHAFGGAFDILDLPGDTDVWVARQMGADATWSRPYNWDNARGMAHVHGVLTGCPHALKSSIARNQTIAVRADFNGLGHLGRGGKDNGPRPLSGRTWEQGIEWAKAQAEEAPMTPAEKQRVDDLEQQVAALADLLSGTGKKAKWADGKAANVLTKVNGLVKKESK